MIAMALALAPPLEQTGLGIGIGPAPTVARKRCSLAAAKPCTVVAVTSHSITAAFRLAVAKLELTSGSFSKCK